MAKLCSQAYHCDFSQKGNTVNVSSGSPIATINYYDRIEKVPCVKKWYKRNCNCEGYINTPCGELGNNLVYNVPNSQAEGSYPTEPGQRIFSEKTWQEQVPKSELSQRLQTAHELYKEGKKKRIEKRNKTIRNVGIGAGIAAAIAGLFALGKQKKRKKEEEELLSGLGQSRRPDEEIMILDENTGKVSNISSYRKPTLKYLDNDEKTALYVLGGIGLLSLTIIILKK